MKSETRSSWQAHEDQIPQAKPLWMHAAKRLQKPARRGYQGNSYLGAIGMGLIMSIPFIVEILKNVV